MIDPTPNEQAAMMHGGILGGGYLEGLGRSDLAQLSFEEWRIFIDVIVTGYCEHLRECANQDRKRLNGMMEAVPF